MLAARLFRRPAVSPRGRYTAASVRGRTGTAPPPGSFTVVCAVLVLAFAQHGAARLLIQRARRAALACAAHAGLVGDRRCWRCRSQRSCCSRRCRAACRRQRLATTAGRHAAPAPSAAPLALIATPRPLLLTLPALALTGTLVAGLAAWRDRALTAFLGSTVALAGTLASTGVALFPFVLPSSLDPAASLSLWRTLPPAR